MPLNTRVSLVVASENITTVRALLTRCSLLRMVNMPILFGARLIVYGARSASHSTAVVFAIGATLFLGCSDHIRTEPTLWM